MKVPAIGPQQVFVALKGLAFLAVAAVAVVVLLDLFGVSDPLGDEPALTESQPDRLPNEYLYLDDERVDAYLGQLNEGLAPSEKRSLSVTRAREAKLGASDVVQVGGRLEEQESVERTVSLRAADRYYVLEGELKRFFQKSAGAQASGFRRVRANARGCDLMANPRAIRDGSIVRITGAKLQLPTYGLALAKVAHAAQFMAPAQRRARFHLSREALSRLADQNQRSLKDYVGSLGPDPRLPLRLTIETGSSRRTCAAFLPARYSKLTDAPSLLTGHVTVVGKVVRRLTRGDPRYFDVETAVTYGRAVHAAAPEIKQALGLEGRMGTKVVSESAIARYPGLVILPLAMYK